MVWALAMLLAACGAAQTQSPEDNPLHTATRLELDVAKALLAQENAWNRGDLEGYVKGYKDSLETIFMGKQVMKGYAQILEDYKHTYPTPASMGTLAFSELEVHPLGESFAVCIGKYHLDRTKKEGGAADGASRWCWKKPARAGRSFSTIRRRRLRAVSWRQPDGSSFGVALGGVYPP